MTTSYWLKTATNFLQSKSITTARLDALVLLEDVLKINRAQLLAEPDMEMREGQVHHLQKLLSRRAKHEPLSYIRGRSEFYGRTFVINQHVLTPRPESETMIDLLKGLYPDRTDASEKLWIADVGTGSGALGITAVLELPNAACDLLEVDKAAQKTAQTNVDLLTTRAYVLESDLLSAARHDYDVLLCNLPYVPDAYELNRAATFEPKIALFAGKDGLDLYRKLFQQMTKLSKAPLYLLTEAFPDQHGAISSLAEEVGYQLSRTDGFIQLFRHVDADIE